MKNIFPDIKRLILFLYQSQRISPLKYLVIILVLPVNIFFSQDRIKFHQLNTKNGLQGFQVNSIAEDQYGYLWIGFEGGLSRYDGKNFTHFNVDPFDSTCLPNPIINEIYCDENSVWLATASGLILYSYITSTFENIELVGGKLESSWISDFDETEISGKKYLWLGMPYVGLVKFDLETKTSSLVGDSDPLFSSLSKELIFKVHADSDNNIWIATHGSGLFRYDPVSEKFSRFFKSSKPGSINDNHILSLENIFSENEKYLWIGTGSGGLNRYDFNKNEFTHYLNNPYNPNSISSNRVLSICKIGNRLLLGTYLGGLSVFDTQQNKFKNYLPGPYNYSIAENIVYSSYVSHTGTVYLGTFENGISYYHSGPESFVSYSKNEGLNANSVYSITKTPEGDVYAAHSKGVDILLNGRSEFISVSTIPALKKLADDRIIFSVHASHGEKGVIWIGTFYNGLLKYNYITQSVKVYKENPVDQYSFNNNSFNSVFEDSRGNIWFGGITTGLNKLDVKTDKIKQYINISDDTTSLSNNYIVYIFEDSKNQIWVCTEAGLNKYNRSSDNFERIFFDKINMTASINSLSCVTEDPGNVNVLWVATAAGLIKYNTKEHTTERFTVNNGLSSNLVLSVLNNGRNEIWIGTTEGLNRLSVNINRIDNFTGINGMDVTQFSKAACYKDIEGNLYFGGSGGFVRFHPDSIDLVTSQNKVVISNFYLFNEKIAPSPLSVLDSSITVKKKLELDYSENNFAFQFTQPNIRDYGGTKFSYILEGFYDEWVNTSDNNIATFTNVPPGNYILKIKAEDRFGNYNNSTRILNVLITPPFWKTWWAYTAYVLLFVASVWSFIEYRSRKLISEKRKLQEAVDQRTEELKKLNADKDRFFSIVAHDIKSPLIALVKFTGIFKKQYHRLSEKQIKESIEDIHSTLNNSYNYLTNLLNWSRFQIGRFEFNPAKINISELIDENIKYFELNTSEKAINILGHYEKQIYAYADYEMISIVLRNLISNAIKFTNKGGNINISVLQNEQQITIEVEDDGVGMKKASLEKMFHIEIIEKTKGTENEDGTGLGLILCKDLVNKNGGDITVESSPGIGSKFYFTIPNFE